MTINQQVNRSVTRTLNMKLTQFKKGRNSFGAYRIGFLKLKRQLEATGFEMPEELLTSCLISGMIKDERYNRTVLDIE